MGNYNTKLSPSELKELEKQLEIFEKLEFERLKPKTVIPTVFLYELLDIPSDWELVHYFFKFNSKEHEKKN